MSTYCSYLINVGMRTQPSREAIWVELLLRKLSAKGLNNLMGETRTGALY